MSFSTSISEAGSVGAVRLAVDSFPHRSSTPLLCWLGSALVVALYCREALVGAPSTLGDSFSGRLALSSASAMFWCDEGERHTVDLCVLSWRGVRPAWIRLGRRSRLAPASCSESASLNASNRANQARASSPMVTINLILMQSRHHIIELLTHRRKPRHRLIG